MSLIYVSFVFLYSSLLLFFPFFFLVLLINDSKNNATCFILIIQKIEGNNRRSCLNMDLLKSNQKTFKGYLYIYTVIFLLPSSSFLLYFFLVWVFSVLSFCYAFWQKRWEGGTCLLDWLIDYLYVFIHLLW